ncbi:shTK domain protein [Teladorsagia circumcincta]|uniref:ShTK domain protein n=1 Tax=Teladorsagia circumcincta TaxID=45464 RepID=A0A2G9TLU2_TELCI|nr:shTK domain protein [Teladorsagia circumcincta]
MLFVAFQLTSRYDTDPTIKSLLEEITFVIVPCVNPDGYEFTRSSTNPHKVAPVTIHVRKSIKAQGFHGGPTNHSADNNFSNHKKIFGARHAPTAKRFRFGDGTEGSCYDLRHACKRWVSERPDLCRSVPIFMRENCAYSCGQC